MSAAEHYESFARVCLRWALEADHDELRRTCLEMADTWRHLALPGSRNGLSSEQAIHCAKCGQPMTLSDARPIRSSGLKEVHYACLSCRSVTTRYLLAR
jgi:hypothetical protein